MLPLPHILHQSSQFAKSEWSQAHWDSFPLYQSQARSLGSGFAESQIGTVRITLLHSCASQIKWLGIWLPSESHSYSRRLQVLGGFSSAWHVLHWAEITKRHRTSSPLASLCFNYTVGFQLGWNSWGQRGCLWKGSEFTSKWKLGFFFFFFLFLKTESKALFFQTTLLFPPSPQPIFFPKFQILFADFPNKLWIPLARDFSSRVPDAVWGTAFFFSSGRISSFSFFSPIFSRHSKTQSFSLESSPKAFPSCWTIQFSNSIFS